MEGYSEDALGSTTTTKYTVHSRDELYQYCSDMSEDECSTVKDGVIGDGIGYSMLEGHSLVPQNVPLGSSNEGVDPEWVMKTRWNRSYQSVQEMEDSVERWEQLGALAHDFVAAATHYASIIVMESHLADNMRTIPASTKFGGTAGGVKYEVKPSSFLCCFLNGIT